MVANPRSSLAACLLVTGVLAISGNAPVKAAVISCLSCEGGSIDFYLGTPLPAANEQKIFLPGTNNVTSFIGNVGSQTGLPTTQFTTDVAVDTANGFSNVKPTGKDDKIGTLTFSVPGYLFGDFMFDVQLDEFGSGRDKGPYPLSIIAYDENASALGSWTFGPNDGDLKAHADLSFLVLSAVSNIDSVVISSLLGTDNVHGMLELKHFQVSELERIAAVPLPAALPLFAGGLGLLGWMARRKRRQAAHA
jgi:hypothetical protein